MGRTYQILFPLLSLFLVRVDLTDCWPLEMKVHITKVYDGDTVQIQHGSFIQKVRLTPIDSPETGQPTLGSRADAGAFSKRCLKQSLKAQGHLLIKGHDIYGRILGDIDGVSLKLIEQGCASVYPFATFRDQNEKHLYHRAWMRAKKLKRGLWAFGGFEQPKAWRKKNLKFRKRNVIRQWRR